MGKIAVGYQGWFNAPNDGSGINPPWWHCAPDRNTPKPGNVGIVSWPDVSDFAKTYGSGFANLGTGGPAALYSNWDAQTVDAQVKWMQDAGIDTIAPAALRRLPHARGKHYQPCVMPGDLSQRQRHHGDFMWRQFFNMIQLGADGIFISMYDEYNEGNQIAKTAATAADVPAGSGFLPLDEDGTKCSSDYYLRLTGDGGKMLRKQIPLSPVRPTPTM